MKLKKTHLFFICYYALTIIGTALAAVLLWDKRSLSFFSLVPCLVIFWGIIVISCYSDFKIRKESEKQHKESQKERKRQEQLESQGKWKK